MVAVGTIIWLSSELMFFAALFAAYFTIRSVSPEMWAENTAQLDVPFAAVNTTILVLSSVTCQMGVFAAERGQVSRKAGLLNVAGAFMSTAVAKMVGGGIVEPSAVTWPIGAATTGSSSDVQCGQRTVRRRTSSVSPSAHRARPRIRRASDSTERIRKAVTNRIRDAVARIAKEDPALARHLSNSIATGTFCRYSPDRGIPWDLREPDVASLPET
jgi:hypothetical protein